MRLVAEDCLRKIHENDAQMDRAISQQAQDSDNWRSIATYNASGILGQLRKLERLIPQVVPPGFIEGWFAETNFRLALFGGVSECPEWMSRESAVHGINLRPYAEEYRNPGDVTKVRNSLVAHLNQVSSTHAIAPTAEGMLRKAQLWVEIECADQRLDRLVGGGLGAGAFGGLRVRPARTADGSEPWHTPWSANGRWDVLDSGERTEAVYDLVEEMLVVRPERATRRLLADMERAANGDAAAWERLRVACGAESGNVHADEFSTVKPAPVPSPEVAPIRPERHCPCASFRTTYARTYHEISSNGSGRGPEGRATLEDLAQKYHRGERTIQRWMGGCVDESTKQRRHSSLLWPPDPVAE
jgi:hypothetical protein